MSIVCVGCDIGQKHDSTAIVVCEYTRIIVKESGEPEPPGHGLDWFNIAVGVADPPIYDTLYTVRNATRMPLGTSYPAVALYINKVCDMMRQRDPQGEVYLGVDVTGVGAPVVDIIAAGLRDDVHITRVTITGTDRCPQAPLAKEHLSMGKTWMVGRLQALLQSRRITLPKTEAGLAIGRELADFQIKVSRDGHADMNAKQGSHDDLVTALGISCMGEAHSQVSYTEVIW